jgi:VWFA-related protein
MREMKAAVLIIVLIAVPIAALTAVTTPQFTMNVGVDLVNVQFTVTDRNGQYAPGLKASDFTVEEDGKKQEILNFSGEQSAPLTIAMVIDISPSVRTVLPEEKATASGFLHSVLRSGDLATVISFDKSIRLEQDYTEKIRALDKAINNLQIGGPGTSLFDAVYLASRELKSEAGRRTIILISDGGDTTSKIKATEAIVAAHQSDAVIFSIANEYLPAFGGDFGTMRKLADETGGITFSVKSRGDFRHVFDEITRSLRSQYSLAYNSTNRKVDGKYREIRVIPKDTSLKVRARKGYYGPSGDSNQ